MSETRHFIAFLRRMFSDILGQSESFLLVISFFFYVFIEYFHCISFISRCFWGHWISFFISAFIGQIFFLRYRYIFIFSSRMRHRYIIFLLYYISHFLTQRLIYCIFSIQLSSLQVSLPLSSLASVLFHTGISHEWREKYFLWYF